MTGFPGNHVRAGFAGIIDNFLGLSQMDLANGDQKPGKEVGFFLVVEG